LLDVQQLGSCDHLSCWMLSWLPVVEVTWSLRRSNGSEVVVIIRSL